MKPLVDCLSNHTEPQKQECWLTFFSAMAPKRTETTPAQYGTVSRNSPLISWTWEGRRCTRTSLLKSERSKRVTPGHLLSGAYNVKSSKPTHLLHFQPLLFSSCDPYGVAARASDSGDPFAARQRVWKRQEVSNVEFKVAELPFLFLRHRQRSFLYTVVVTNYRQQFSRMKKKNIETYRLVSCPHFLTSHNTVVGKLDQIGV